MVSQGWAIEIERLSFAYPDGRRALQEITFQVAAGEKVVLAGANGAGKSTLLLHLNGLFASPCVRVAGLPVVPANLKVIRRKVGLVFQNPDDQLFCPTIFEDVAFGPRNLKMAEDEVQRRVLAALARVGLAGFGPRRAPHLSAGQKKRAALATVLSLEAEILVLDEPTSNLDPRGRRELLEVLQQIGGTQIIATHDFDFALKLCERAIVLDQGRCVAAGPSGALLADKEFLLAHSLM